MVETFRNLSKIIIIVIVKKIKNCKTFYDSQNYHPGEQINWANKTTILEKDPKHFGKLLAINKKWYDTDFVLFTDMDIVFLNFNEDVRDFFDDDTQLVFSKIPIHGINAGNYAMRTTEYSWQFLQEWWEYRSQTDAHGDQGALYDMLLKRVISLTDQTYGGECRTQKMLDKNWGYQTGCFNAWMIRLGHEYPDWSKAWDSKIKITSKPKLAGFPFEHYANRPEEKYQKSHYSPFNYDDVLDVASEKGDLMVHFSSTGLSQGLRDKFKCETGWNASDIFGCVKNKIVYSSDIHTLKYGYKHLSEHGQKWMNPKNKTLTWSIPKVNDFSHLKVNGRGPSFIGIGCGHCGSTSLYTSLMQHPQLIPGKMKEVLYLGNNPTILDQTQEGYLNQFPSTSPWTITGEFSPYYLSDPKVPEQIKDFVPHAKLLLMLRDPLEQCRSAYGYEKVLDAMTKSNSCDFYKLLSEADPAIRKLRQYHPCDIQMHYIDSVARYQQHFANNQLLLISSEEFRETPEKVMMRIEEFLGLPHFNNYFTKYTSNMHQSKKKSNKINLPLAHCFDEYRSKVEDILNGKSLRTQIQRNF